MNDIAIIAIIAFLAILTIKNAGQYCYNRPIIKVLNKLARNF